MTSELAVIGYREAAAPDAAAIASLHIDSWRRNYRGAYADTYLDGDVFADRRSLWTHRLTERRPNQQTIVAEAEGAILGFAHTILNEDPKWGALLENLHVTRDLKRQGIGTQLIAETAQAVLDSSPSTGIYLWVLEQNKAAQAFYEARGGTCVGRGFALPPGGDPSRLTGEPAKLQYAWPDPATLTKEK